MIDPTEISRKNIGVKLGDEVLYLGNPLMGEELKPFINTRATICKPRYCKKTKVFDVSAADTICIKLLNGWKIFTDRENIKIN